MNIKYITDLKTQDYLEMLKLWNDEMGKIYPINPGSFDYNVIDYKDKRGMKAIEENGKIVGFVILKEFHEAKMSKKAKSEKKEVKKETKTTKTTKTTAKKTTKTTKTEKAGK